jgi:hypothetical protein
LFQAHMEPLELATGIPKPKSTVPTGCGSPIKCGNEKRGIFTKLQEMPTDW